jgi:hypothetical protein
VTLVAAFSFLLHFGLLSALYSSDWNDGIHAYRRPVKGLSTILRMPQPPLVEAAGWFVSSPSPLEEPKTEAPKNLLTAAEVLAILGQLAAMDAAVMDALSATVIGGPASIHGARIRTADRTLALARAQVWACYQAGLKQKKDMAGSLFYHLIINRFGRVSSVALAPTGGLSGQVIRCIRTAFGKLSFEAPQGESSTIDGSFSLAPAQPAEPLGSSSRPRQRARRRGGGMWM